MAHREPFAETVTQFDPPAHHHVFSPVPEQLTERERTELQDLMLHRIVGPGGQAAIATDRELTEWAKSTGKPQASAC